MAAGLLQHALQAEPEPLRSLSVLSAGVAARDGELVSANSVTALKKVGIDIAGYKSRYLTQELASKALAIFCMTESHRAMIRMQIDPPPQNVFLFREFMPKGNDLEIPDPFGGPLSVYEVSRDEMVEAIPSLLQFLRKLVAEQQA